MKDNKSQFFSTREVIKKWLDQCDIENYKINDDLSVDVGGGVNLYNKNLKFIPIKFGKVTGSFWCRNNKLKSLIGSPKSVGGDFNCISNELTNLKGSPVSIGGEFRCVGNNLISLVEIINCNFKEKFLFNIDKKNFQQKELIQVLEQYYNLKYGIYILTGNEFHNTVNPFLEKNVLKKNLRKTGRELKFKKSFI